MFIYANTDINAKEELTTLYFPLDEYDIREKKTQCNHNFLNFS